MSAYAHYEGVRLVSGAVSIPLVGWWAANITLAVDATVPPSGSLVLGNLALHGTIVRQAAFAGSRNALLVGGAGGWRRNIGKQQYQNDGGVSLSTILGDAAREVGESVNVPNDVSLPGYVRRAGPASTLLRELAGTDYHVDPGGVTQIAPWASSTVRSQYDVIEHAGGTGVVEVATEDYAAHLPGSVLQSPLLAAPVRNAGSVLRIGADDVWRLTVMTANS